MACIIPDPGQSRSIPVDGWRNHVTRINTPDATVHHRQSWQTWTILESVL